MPSSVYTRNMPDVQPHYRQPSTITSLSRSCCVPVWSVLAKMQLLSVAFLPILFASQAAAATWYFLRYNTPSGAKFTTFSGQMVVPTLPKAAVYYLWPGLQPTDNSGVYQNVLDGRSGTWWFGSGWCCSNPSLPWGGGFNTYAGETSTFSNVLNSDGSGWTTTTTRGSNGSPVTNTFALGKSWKQIYLHAMSQGLYVIDGKDVSADALDVYNSGKILQPSNLCH